MLYKVSSFPRSVLFSMVLMSFATACSDNISIVRINKDMSAVPWEAVLNHHAATLSTFSPWDTMQLSMTALTSSGDTVYSDSAIVSYESLDSNMVSVTPDGKVQAKVVNSGTSILASMTIGEVTYKDTIIVRVEANASPRTLSTLSIQPLPPDSAKTSVSTAIFTLQRFLKITATDDLPMTGLLVHYKSLNPIANNVNRSTGMFGPLAVLKSVGPVTFVASTYAFGVAKADTLYFQMGYPININTYFQIRASVDSIGKETYLSGGTTIGVGGVVIFRNNTDRNVYLEFEDTTDIEIAVAVVPNESINRVLGHGQDATLDGTYSARRRFTKPGTYRFRDQASGVSSVIEVIKE